jgi:hypothetical protein
MLSSGDAALVWLVVNGSSFERFWAILVVSWSLLVVWRLQWLFIIINLD